MKKRSNSPKKRTIIPLLYRSIHVICSLYGGVLLFFSGFGLVLFWHEKTMRINQLAGLLVSLIGSVILFLPVHKTADTKKLTGYFYALTIAVMLLTGLLTYPTYLITMTLLFLKLFITMLRLFGLLTLSGEAMRIRPLLIRGVVLSLFVLVASIQGIGYLQHAYGRKIPSRIMPTPTPKPLQQPARAMPDLGVPIPGKPTRIWQLDDKTSLLETTLWEHGGNFPTLFIIRNNAITRVAQATGIQFNDGIHTIGNFGNPVVSPDNKYVFIEEQGYEGGRTHAINLITASPLEPQNYPSMPGIMHWSPDGRCIVGELYEYGDTQALQLGVENGNGYTMYPYEQSVSTAMGLENTLVLWKKGSPCTAFLTFTAGLMIYPKGAGENMDEEILFDMKHGPVKRNRWQPLFDLQSSKKSALLRQIYP